MRLLFLLRIRQKSFLYQHLPSGKLRVLSAGLLHAGEMKCHAHHGG